MNNKYINKKSLFNWLNDRIDMEWSCVDDLELTEGERNDWHRGKIAAYEELLCEIDEEYKKLKELLKGV